jgi:glycosyltransferase involved in cell wall biosynthesis
MKSIHIITISDGKLKPLKLTLKSIDNQNFKGFKNFVISKKKISNIKNKYKSKKRVFIHKKNSSIYEAMNYGLAKSKSNHLIFLNSGDTFFSNSSLNTIAHYIKKIQKIA